jgi:hypothetical protein
MIKARQGVLTREGMCCDSQGSLLIFFRGPSTSIGRLPLVRLTRKFGQAGRAEGRELSGSREAVDGHS